MTTSTPASPIYRFVADRMRRGDSLFALADAARDVELALRSPRRLNLDSASLFEGRYATTLAHVAPHLISLAPDSPFLDLWEKKLGSAAGILIVAPFNLPALRAHLRSLFIAHDENGHAYNFRFYDPRVLRVYFPTCNGPDAAEFFGPIYRVILESESTGLLWSCRAERLGVHIGARRFGAAGDIDSETHL